MLGLSRLNSSLLTSFQEIHNQGRSSALITSWDWCEDADEVTLLELPLPECEGGCVMVVWALPTQPTVAQSNTAPLSKNVSATGPPENTSEQTRCGNRKSLCSHSVAKSV